MHLAHSSSHRSSSIESLERRRLLAIAVNSGVLTLTGSGSADTFLVANNSPTTLTVSENAGVPQIVSGVTSVLANLGGGNDTIIISPDVEQNAVLNGEAGNDTLTGGAGDDTLDGGAGDDSLDAAGGVDTVSYASHATAVTANLAVLFDSLQHLQSITGTGGSSGEIDHYANAETLTGGSGNDSLTATAGPSNTSDTADLVTVRLNGAGGNDTLLVAGVIDGNVPKSVPHQIADGGDGDDDLTANYNRSDATTLIGGDGDDVFHNNDDSSTTIDPGAGYDTYDFHTVGVTTFTMPLGLEQVNATGGSAATITGNSEANHIVLGSGGEAFGLDGDDIIETGPSANCTLDGGDGNDTLTATNSGDNLFRPGTGNDSIVGGNAHDMVTYVGHAAAVTASLQVTLARTGSVGNYSYTITSAGTASSTGGEVDTYVNVETIVGGAGNDALTLSAVDSPYWLEVPDRPVYGFAGGEGNDALDSTALNSSNLTNQTSVDLFADGGEGDDTIISGAGSSEVYGQSGNDTIRLNDTGGIEAVGTGRNNVDGGDGDDLIVINGGTDTVHGGLGDDSIYAGVGDDRVYGDSGEDRLNGDGGKDTIYGGNDSDRIYGNSGADRLFGELGIDRLYGGNKNDYLDGGAGGDYAKGDEDIDTAKKDRTDRRYQTIEIFV